MHLPKPAIEMTFMPARHPHAASITCIDTTQVDLMSVAISHHVCTNSLLSVIAGLSTSSFWDAAAIFAMFFVFFVF